MTVTTSIIIKTTHQYSIVQLIESANEGHTPRPQRSHNPEPMGITTAGGSDTRKMKYILWQYDASLYLYSSENTDVDYLVGDNEIRE